MANSREIACDDFDGLMTAEVGEGGDVLIRGDQRVVKQLTGCKKLRALQEHVSNRFRDIRAKRAERRFDLPPGAVQQLIEMMAVKTETGAQDSGWALIRQDVACGLGVARQAGVANLLAFGLGLEEVDVSSGGGAGVKRCKRLASGVSVIEIAEPRTLPVQRDLRRELGERQVGLGETHDALLAAEEFVRGVIGVCELDINAVSKREGACIKQV